jgi:hypothetical protein
MLRVIMEDKPRAAQSGEHTAALAPIIHEKVSLYLNPRVQVTKTKLAGSSWNPSSNLGRAMIMLGPNYRSDLHS